MQAEPLCRRCGTPERNLNECSERDVQHDMPPTLEFLEQKLVALEQALEAKRYVPSKVDPPAKVRSVMDC